MTKQGRKALILKIAKVLVHDWFKTNDEQSVIDLLTGDNVPLSGLTDKTLLDYEMK